MSRACMRWMRATSKFADATFDTVVAMYVMTVVPDPRK